MNHKKIGRPTESFTQRLAKVKYTLNLDSLSKLYKAGLTDDQVADFFNISEEALDKWKKLKPLNTPLKTWKSEADEKVEMSLYQRACGYTHAEEKIFCANGIIIKTQTLKHYPPEPISMIFWLKNRQPEKWKDRREVIIPKELIEEEINLLPDDKNGEKANRIKQYLFKNDNI